jgi:hypothetical protein
MLQHHLELSVSRRTGESLQTIQQRGFSLMKPKPPRHSTRKRRPNSTSMTASPGAVHSEYDDFDD